MFPLFFNPFTRTLSRSEDLNCLCFLGWNAFFSLDVFPLFRREWLGGSSGKTDASATAATATPTILAYDAFEFMDSLPASCYFPWLNYLPSCNLSMVSRFRGCWDCAFCFGRAGRSVVRSSARAGLRDNKDSD